MQCCVVIFLFRIHTVYFFIFAYVLTWCNGTPRCFLEFSAGLTLIDACTVVMRTPSGPDKCPIYGSVLISKDVMFRAQWSVLSMWREQLLVKNRNEC